jgi:triacylglycerol lipase
MPNFAFDAQQTAWSDRNALSCAMAAQLAYSDAPAVDAGIKSWGFSQSVFLDRRGTQGFLAGSDEMILVAFRGTEPAKLKDWMTDADVDPVGFLGGKVHAGFLRALRGIWDDLNAAIDTLQRRSQSLWITGHSLGAALATLATARFRLESGTPVHGLYTFGSPRVGDGDFGLRFNQDFQGQTFRYVNNADVVTRVPNRVPFGYRHVGTFLFFDDAGDIQSDVHWWNKFLNEVQGNIDDLLSGKIAALDDHFIANYIRNAQKNLGKNPF